MVIIEGWPADIPFRNLSEASNSLTGLGTLLRKWRCGKIYWREVTEAGLRDRDNQIEGGELEDPAPRRRRSDHGKKRPRTNPAGDRRKKHHKSRSTIQDSDEEEEDNRQSRPSTPDTEG